MTTTMEVTTREMFQCDICSRELKTKTTLWQHKRNIHKVCSTKAIKKYFCDICSQGFATYSGMYKHKKKTHKWNPTSHRPRHVASFHCTQCSESFSTSKEIICHYKISHTDRVLTEECFTFQNCQEFYQWKEATEKDTVSRFVFRSRYKTKNSTVDIFHCSRSGTYKPRGSGKRELKVAGSNKIGRFCPAMMTVTISESVINVKFISTHFGHTMEPGRLPLSKSDKDALAGKLICGVSKRKILEDVCKEHSPTSRLLLTTRKDLWNISASYNIKGDKIFDNCDAVSVDTWVKIVQSEHGNPILVYKPQGEVSCSFPQLAVNDFMLGFMNDAQQAIFERYGHKVLSIDSTHGTNQYGIELTSILVIDDDCEGFPVAFLYSNRQTQSHFKIFFEAIKERIQVCPMSFMSDGAPALYNAWLSVFGPVKFHLLCDWHFKRAISENIKKVIGKEKQDAVLNKVWTMQEEPDENAFLILLSANIAAFLADPDMNNFGKYFESNYGNRVCQWAFCYRKGAQVNTNMVCERWHRDIKYFSNINGKQGGRLDKAISSLMKSLQKKILGCSIAIQRHKLTSKIAELRRRHMHSKQMMDVPVVENVTGKKWTVTSETYLDLYDVEKVKDSCSCNVRCTKCLTCLHIFTCSCIDNCIKYNMCKHIHLVCQRYPEKRVEENESNSDHDLVIGNDDNDHEEMQEFDAISKKLKEKNAFDNTTDDRKSQARMHLMALEAELEKSSTLSEIDTVIHMLKPIIPRLRAVRSATIVSLPPPSVLRQQNKNIVPQ